MNYASFKVRKRDLPQLLANVCERLAAKFKRLEPHIDWANHFIVFKPGCIMPFYIERGKLIFTSVAVPGMLRSSHPTSEWHSYVKSFFCTDAVTYLQAYTKALLCDILDQDIDDEGIGKYRENPRANKFKSLKAWQKHQTPRPSLTGLRVPIAKKLIKLDASRTIKQDRKFLPELF